MAFECRVYSSSTKYLKIISIVIMFQFRDEEIARKIYQELKKRNLNLKIMHVCGTHQDTLVRHGLDKIFFDVGIDVREGPGCPVCVTTIREIEEVKAIASKATIALYGDMLRSPGKDGSLADERAKGKDIRVVYSIEDAVEMAEKNKRPVVFFGVGFETTAPSTAYIIKRMPPNFYVYSSHRRTPPAVIGIAAMGRVDLDGIILPGHVSTIIGSKPWEPISEKYGIPQVIAGFEPLDMLMAVYMIVRQIEDGDARVEIEYSRVVKPEGNKKALDLLDEVFYSSNVEWRGFPVLKESGLEIKEEYDEINAKKVFEDVIEPVKDQEFEEPPGCRCSEVIRGEIHSWECPLFGKVCTPATPVGPCMVSSEGACAIEYKYGHGKNY